MSVQYVEKVYNFWSFSYDFVFRRVFASGRELAPQLLNLFPGHKMLEVGVGTGLTLPLLPRDIDITGIDVSQGMLNKASKRVAKLGLDNVKLAKMDATKLEFPDSTFDRVLAAYVVSVVPDPVAVVREMMRVCKPGGYLLIINHFCSEHFFGRLFDKLVSPITYRIGFNTNLDLYKLVERCGLKIDVLQRVDFLGNWKAVRCVNPKAQ
ncbi:MAG: class I SAM-dependent methyltransferase [Phycisphaerae bacterium]|nr:class I SAM-dependent methyltransferase [Phycisphaerae bacterium]